VGVIGPVSAEGHAVASEHRGPSSAGWRGRWYERAQGAAAASIVLLALFFGRGMFLASPQVPGAGSTDAAASLHEAYSSLQLLVDSLESGAPPQTVFVAARKLVTSRAAAVASGVDVRRLDAAISSRVPSALTDV